MGKPIKIKNIKLYNNVSRLPPLECIEAGNQRKTNENIASARKGICLGTAFVYQTIIVKTNIDHKTNLYFKHFRGFYTGWMMQCPVFDTSSVDGRLLGHSLQSPQLWISLDFDTNNTVSGDSGVHGDLGELGIGATEQRSKAISIFLWSPARVDRKCHRMMTSVSGNVPMNRHWRWHP